MNYLGVGQQDEQEPLPGSEYLRTLHKYLTANFNRLAPAIPKRPTSTEPSFLQQSYTLLTLGLDPNSQPLSRNVVAPLTLGFGQPSQPTNPRQAAIRPLLLRLPPDRLLFLLLRWQSLPQNLPHVGRTDEPIAPGVPVAARGAAMRERKGQGDVESVRSWVGSMRSVSMGSMRSTVPGFGWMKREEMDEDAILLALYRLFIQIPALLIHPPFVSDRPIADLVDAGGYTQFGGIDVRVPLDVMRNLHILELEGYDPRGLLIPTLPTLHSLTVRNVQDGDDWIEELLAVKGNPRFPNLRHLSLSSGSLLDLPNLPLDTLVSIDLSHNLLENLPTALSACHSLQRLNLSDNVIHDLRSAPSILGNITTLNLARNRIDCVVGLERVKGLERVDLRGNEIHQWDEVGRLADLPHVREVWYAGNPCDDARDETRIELGVIFAQHGNPTVVFDDKPWSWSEERRIESIMSARGIAPKTRSREPSRDRLAPSSTPQTHYHPPPPPTPSRLQPSPVPSSLNSPTPSHVLGKKKRPPRRVINLDDDTPTVPEDEAVGGSMRLPSKSAFDANSGQSLQVKKKERRRVSASMFEPSVDTGKD